MYRERYDMDPRNATVRHIAPDGTTTIMSYLVWPNYNGANDYHANRVASARIANLCALRARPVDYRGYSIEQETDMTFSTYGATGGYIRGRFRSADDARRDIDSMIADLISLYQRAR